MKEEEIIVEAGKVGLMCQQISGEFLNKLSPKNNTDINTLKCMHARFPQHNDVSQNTYKNMREFANNKKCMREYEGL